MGLLKRDAWHKKPTQTTFEFPFPQNYPATLSIFYMIEIDKQFHQRFLPELWFSLNLIDTKSPA